MRNTNQSKVIEQAFTLETLLVALLYAVLLAFCLLLALRWVGLTLVTLFHVVPVASFDLFEAALFLMTLVESASYVITAAMLAKTLAYVLSMPEHVLTADTPELP